MIYGFGPRARRVYTLLRDRITRGDWPPGDRLPSHRELAAELSVAPLTVRQVLARLEEDGLVSRQVGRGTFVREIATPAIAMIGMDATMGAFLGEYVRRAGFRALNVGELAQTADAINRDQATVLVLCELDGREPAAEIETVRALRLRWPDLPLAVIVADLDVLRPLFGTSEWPLQVLPKPVNLGLLDDVLRLAARPRASPY